jgi:hypothetical protein
MYHFCVGNSPDTNTSYFFGWGSGNREYFRPFYTAPEDLCRGRTEWEILDSRFRRNNTASSGLLRSPRLFSPERGKHWT